MRNWSVLTVALVAMIPVSASADSAAAVKQQVLANYSKMMAAFSKHDMKGVMAIASDDYEGEDEMGEKIDRAKMQTMMKAYMDTTKKINSSSYDVSGVRVTGDKATGKSVFNMDAVILDEKGEMGPKGKTHRMKMTQYTNVTWKKVGGKWLVQKETPAGAPKVTVDGKPLAPPAPGGPKKP